MNPSSKPRILHIINLDTVGGVETLFTHFVEESLTKVDHEIVLTGNKPHSFFKKIAKTCPLFYEKYFLGIKLPKCLRPLQQSLLLNELSKKSYTHAIIWNRLQDIQKLKKALKKTPIIYYEHGASWIAKKQFIPNIFNNTCHIFACSFAAKRMLELKWQPHHPITVIHNPLRDDIEQPKKIRSIRNKERFILGYVGRLVPLKGVAILIYTLEKLLSIGFPIELHIIGDGPERTHLESIAKNLHVRSSITFHGAIKDMSKAYAMIDLLVVPSIREPLGLVAVEAAYTGCPVIATRIDGLSEVVLNGITGYTIYPTLEKEAYTTMSLTNKSLPDLVYDSENDALISPKVIDPQELADTIQKIFSQPDLYEKMTKEAISFAEKRPFFIDYVNTLLQEVIQIGYCT